MERERETAYLSVCIYIVYYTCQASKDSLQSVSVAGPHPLLRPLGSRGQAEAVETAIWPRPWHRSVWLVFGLPLDFTTCKNAKQQVPVQMLCALNAEKCY